MKLKQTAPIISESDPFSVDRLDRKKLAETLTQFINSIDEPLTISIEAGWGHGKSTFLRMWTQHLRNQGFTCISFNAWEGDFSEDPLIPFVSELRKAIVEIQEKDSSKRITEISEKLRKAGIQIAKRTLPAAAKILTAGLLDTEELIEDAAGSAIEKAIEQKFDEYEADKNNLASFKIALSELVSELKAQKKPIPLVFLIDELDRCRPTFALSLLERIKHIFNVDGIAFVIAIDREQLAESTRTVYGPNTDATRYLRRFIDYAYTLPDPSPEKYPEHLMEVMNFRNRLIQSTSDSYAPDHFIKTFVALSTSFGLRLRDQEHAFSIMTVVWRTLSSREHIDPFVLAALLVMKVANPEMYYQFVKGKFPLDQFYELIQTNPAGKEFMETNYGWVFEAMLDTHAGEKSYVSNKQANIRNSSIGTGAPASMVRKWSIMQPIYENGIQRREFAKIVSCIEATRNFLN